MGGKIVNNMNTTKSEVWRTFVAATIHKIWAERGRRRMNQMKYTTQELCSKIVNDMQLYLQRRLGEVEDYIELRVLMSRLNIEVSYQSKHITWIKWINPEEDVIMLNWQGNEEMAFLVR
ncbi:hypothetical protein IFM89_024567 [Coptis chinensis]|uniref:Uncharacterized protein n=1 Tax=Coptis chinensis TaxID=261450 RepID=A0A835LZG8_9MAGN|nr:hypothetical protein IFM89_024567 [Coptis chinensis]